MEFLPLIIVGLLMYVVLILPQQRRNREHKALLASLEEGDEVMISSGIYGFIAAVEPEVIWLEVADGTELKIAKSSVSSKVVVSEETDEDS
ncbi:MAG: preprotein translocase subunit YajC [Actinomycetota bacterium]